MRYKSDAEILDEDMTKKLSSKDPHDRRRGLQLLIMALDEKGFCNTANFLDAQLQTKLSKDKSIIQVPVEWNKEWDSGRTDIK